MKQKTLLLITLLGGLAASRVRADIVFQDTFDYPNGTLSNATWVAGAGNTLNNAILATNQNTAFIRGASSSDLPRAYFTNAPAGIPSASSAPNFPNTVFFFPTNNGITPALYYSFTLNAATAPANSGVYFSYITDTNFNFRTCIFVTTNKAAPGTYRLGILYRSVNAFAQTNSSGVVTNVVQQDLSVGQTYFVTAKYAIDTGVSTLYINPTNEFTTATNMIASTSPTNGVEPILGYNDGATTNSAAAGIGLRATSTSTSGNLQVTNLIVATTFNEVLPTIPEFTVQPQDNPFLIQGNNVTLQSLAVANDSITYQWFFVTNSITNTLSDGTLADGATITGSSSNNLNISNLTTNETGFYFSTATTGTTNNSSRTASITVFAQAEFPTISSPTAAFNQTNLVGDVVSLSVTAAGVPPPSYKWFFVTNNVTNAVAGTAFSGTNTSTLTIASAATNQSAGYFCTVTNIAGKTNSPLVTLVINPTPSVTIAQFRSMVDNNFNPTNTTTPYTLTGIVTTWTNMTTSRTSTEFYMQDASGGIAVFWSGANVTNNLPPAGTLVQVTGPAAAFDGLLEIEPVFGNALHKVVMLSSNNPLPTPQPLPFDPNVTGNTALMKRLESSYFVASNVTLTAGTTFGSGVNEDIFNNARHVLSATNSVLSILFTNDVGQTFTVFLNAATDIPGKPKYSGPVTIFGILGFFTGAGNTGGFEFTPSRYADIVSYTHSTNYLSNLTRLGDAPTNTFTESVLRPGESLTMDAVIGDPEGGTVSLTGFTAGLPADAYWTNITSGVNATAQFVFNPTAADEGSNYVVSLGSSSTSGTANTNVWYVYVPTAQEQQVYISEFLANPTTNSSSPFHNPLNRAFDTNNVTANDQYVELVNQSGTDLDLFSWSLTDANTLRHAFLIGEPVEQLAAANSNSVIVYGGPLPEGSDPSPPQTPVPFFPANQGGAGLSLSASGNGVIVLRNPNYYNSGLGIQPGYIVDRIVYGSLPTNGSLSRFPRPNGVLDVVPQALVSTHATTAGLQYDGSNWLTPTQTPGSVTNVTVVPGNPTTLNFTAIPGTTATLWQAGPVQGPYAPVKGTTSGVFSITNPPLPSQFFYLTTQTNY